MTHKTPISLNMALCMKRLCYLSVRTMSTVGFIGLGNMGAPMAKNLVKAGREVVVYDVSESSVSSLEKEGAGVAVSPADVAARSDVIITMVPSSPHIQQVFTGSEGILQSLKPGTICIDSSTIDPAVSKEISSAVRGAGAHFYDAPVSGGVPAAESGALTFMVGGDEGKFSEVKSYLDHMGANVVHCGANGNGLVVKLCNNMMLGISMIGAAETLNMGVKMGMDKQLLSEILSKSTARCWSIDTYNPVPGVLEGVPASREYQGGFGASLMLKDLGLAELMAQSAQSQCTLGNMAKQIYTEICENEEYVHKDFGVIYKKLSSE